MPKTKYKKKTAEERIDGYRNHCKHCLDHLPESWEDEQQAHQRLLEEFPELQELETRYPDIMQVAEAIYLTYQIHETAGGFEPFDSRGISSMQQYLSLLEKWSVQALEVYHMFGGRGKIREEKRIARGRYHKKITPNQDPDQNKTYVDTITRKLKELDANQ